MASIFSHTLQDMKKCGSAGRDCIEKNSAETFNCNMNCKGMYADISWKIGKMNDVKDKGKYSMLSSEYRNFKKENMRHFRFSSEEPLSNFGKQILRPRKSK